MTTYRRKMCEDCAFRKESLEMNHPERKAELIINCETKTFFCHQTMLNTDENPEKWVGSFDITKRPDGSPAARTDHQICAGFAAMYRPRVDVDYSDIDLTGHAFEDMIRSDMATEAEVKAMSPEELEAIHG